MRVLENLEPKRVFYYFEELCNIPHGSGNVEAISNYLKGFAQGKGLEVIQDEVKNIIIIKEASEGYEQEPPVIIQGHMDMVAVSKPELNIDMKKEPLKLKVEGDRISAEGTSLGGDDGIAVAYALAILEDDTIKHPRLEVIITVDEETGMDGARVIDLSMLKGNRLLNLDSEEEGIFLTGCAGGARVDCRLKPVFTPMQGLCYDLKLGGLAGGHSGVEIHKERGNSNKLAGRLLWHLYMEEINIGLVCAQGGLADNAIPRETTMTVLVPEMQKEPFEKAVRAFEAVVKAELVTKDSSFAVSMECGTVAEKSAICENDYAVVAAFINALPNGVQAMSAEVQGKVETSLNLGILKIDEEKVQASFSVRSSIEGSKQALIEKLMSIVVLAGGEAEVQGDYPGWSYRVDSPLRDKMVALYKEMYGTEPQIEVIHAGLECGLLASKINDLDCVSIGPNMSDIHTTEENLSIASTERVWQYLLRLLETKG
ncbi:MAG: aminoacyl-histidine dipeptidase [Lachnospiraceae bacterium]|nr:aminoacyl-histidine dipeptidase [Lachnospiraceae bacterium]